MDIETFLQLPTDEIAQQVSAEGTGVCVFPINGTRRWFMLEHAQAPGEDATAAYLKAITQSMIELYQMLFDHGIHTVLTPALSSGIMARGAAYMQMMSAGFAQLTSQPQFLDFYKAYGIRVRFYGDYRKALASTPYAYLSDLFDELTAQTAAHARRRLFFGLFDNDHSETLAELAVRFYIEHGHTPAKRELIEMYYGEEVGPVDFFISFSKPRSFHVPLLSTASEDLYFTVSPSPYMTQQQLRSILYDHLYARCGDCDYATLPPDDRDAMRRFYQANVEKTLGVGMNCRGNWYPLPQVQLPEGFDRRNHES